MTMLIMGIAAALSGAAVQQAAPPPEPPMMTPVAPTPRVPFEVPLGSIGSWTLYREAKDQGECGVSRNYGTIDDPAGIVFEATFGQLFMNIYLVSKVNGGDEAAGDGGLALDTGARADGVYRIVNDPARSLRFGQITIDRIVFDALGLAKTVQIRAGKTMTIPAQDVKAALAILAACRDRTFASWGLDPKLISYDHPVPMDGKLASWFSYDDYPAAARRANVSGRVVMVIDVGGDGLIKACHVVISAGADLDTTSCALALRRGRFPPSAGAAANAIVSQMLVPVRWALYDE